jgi:hypothetical protein
MGNQGHYYEDRLMEDEKETLLKYLKYLIGAFISKRYAVLLGEKN